MAARLTAFLVSAIVAVTFVAGLIVGAQREDDGGPADLIIHNAHVYVGASADAAEALAIRDGKIIRVGSNKDIDRLRRRQTLDAAGGTVAPGLNDAGLELFDSELATTATATESAIRPSIPATATAAAAPAAASSAPAPASPLETLRKTIAEAHRVGLTSVQTTVRSAEDLALLNELEKQDELNLRVFVALTTSLPVDESAADSLDALRKETMESSRLVKVGAVKLAAHAPDARTSPRARTGSSTRRPTPDAVASLANAIKLLDARQWQVILSTSTAADAAFAADAFQHAFGDDAPSTILAHRHRIELSSSVDSALAARLDALELSTSIPAASIIAAAPTALSSLETPPLVPQPSKLMGSTSEVPDDTATDAVASPAAAIATASSSPSSLAALLTGPRTIVRSEWPAGPFDPMRTFSAALAGAPEPVESLAAVLDAYTSHAAFASHDEPSRGSIAKDQAADLVIFSTDLFSVPPDRPFDAIVLTTIVDGKVVFKQNAPTPAPKPKPAAPAATTEQ